MTNPLAAQFEEMLAEYQKARTSMEEVQERMRSANATVKSDNKMISVSVDAQGEITDLVFHTKTYRTMAPAELAKVLLAAIAKARAAVMEQLQDATAPFLPAGTSFDDIRQGKFDYGSILPEQPFSLDEMSPAVRQLASTLLTGRPGAETE
jgi:DNA-binding protein YbaB